MKGLPHFGHGNLESEVEDHRTPTVNTTMPSEAGALESICDEAKKPIPTTALPRTNAKMKRILLRLYSCHGFEAEIMCGLRRNEKIGLEKLGLEEELQVAVAGHWLAARSQREQQCG